MSSLHALRGMTLHFNDDPGTGDEPREGSVEFHQDGLVIIQEGRILHSGSAQELLETLPEGTPIDHWANQLIMPGFIDPHLHYSQLDITASYGRQLLDWLNTYTFPEECRFSDRAYADEIANAFLEQLLANGVTTALAFCTTHPASVDALFSAALERNMRMLGGKVMMDRNAPEALCDTPETGIRDSRKLIEQWHERGRLEYAITPRFAPTSTPEQLTATGQLLSDYPGMVLQTHLSENLQEVDWVASLFPEARDYLDVYSHYQLVRPRAIFAHGIHIDDDVRQRLADDGGAIAFCPSSNLFLGSGLFDWRSAREQEVRVGIASDIGAGTSFSPFQTLQDAYKVGQLSNQPLTPWQAFYAHTLGNARVLDIDRHVGSLAAGMEADITVINPRATPMLARKDRHDPTLMEQLFNLMILGDERCISATYVMGKKLHDTANN
ncbi:guanine deaminase [Kushneria indalinina]|uniref:Guanine deaminase n=1 Tax=Kushneria indalinina DSM 14324 TaxID=1122140 RepID=A0A3D9DZU0_9GAMM|nr:guanine deaminase [Kushneria indalinina]REC96308.1 guanine deaminase [Kushneria indalinina DSM 14324]